MSPESQSQPCVENAGSSLPQGPSGFARELSKDRAVLEELENGAQDGLPRLINLPMILYETPRTLCGIKKWSVSCNTIRSQSNLGLFNEIDRSTPRTLNYISNEQPKRYLMPMHRRDKTMGIDIKMIQSRTSGVLSHRRMRSIGRLDLQVRTAFSETLVPLQTLRTHNLYPKKKVP